MSRPVRYRVNPPRMSEMAAWVRLNEVDPQDVPYPSLMFVGTDDGVNWRIEYEAYQRSPGGKLMYDPATDTFRYETRTVPMVYDPPMWWLVEDES